MGRALVFVPSFRFLLTGLAFLFAIIAIRVSWADTTPVYNPANGHYYGLVIFPDTNSFADTKAAAEVMSYAGLGGHLATITSQEEQDFVYALFGATGARIGAIQPGDAGTPDPDPAAGWEWVTGEPWGYTAWIGGEPNDCGCQGYDEDTIQLKAGGWNDVDGGGAGGFVVEYDVPLVVSHLDHYLAYAAKLARSTRFQPRNVQLADVFQGSGQVEEEASIFRVEKPVLLGNPVDKNGEGVYSEDLHLVAYKVTRISGETYFTEGVLVENQFGSLTVDVRQDPDLLMLPSTKSLSDDAPEDEAIFGGDRHFLCYPVSAEFSELTVSLDDQFTDDAAGYTVTKAKRLCAPVEKTVVDSEGQPQGDTAGDAEGDEYLMCYVVQKGARGRPTLRQPRVDNQFGGLRLITSRETMLCVPSAVTLPGE